MSLLTKEREAEIGKLLNREWSDCDASAFLTAAEELRDEVDALRGKLAQAKASHDAIVEAHANLHVVLNNATRERDTALSLVASLRQAAALACDTVSRLQFIEYASAGNLNAAMLFIKEAVGLLTPAAKEPS